MSYTLQKLLSKRSNYGNKRKTSSIRYIVIHYTANDGDTAKANATYFQRNKVGASAHYFVDDTKVFQSVPDSYIAWSVGGFFTKASGAGRLYGICTNANSLSVEMCDTNKNGTLMVTAKTQANTIELVKKLMKQYNIPASRVVRHWDVNGKSCPVYFKGNNNEKWKAFQKKLTTSKAAAKKPSITSTYYKKCSGKCITIYQGLTNIGVNASYAYRVKIANKNGIGGKKKYVGSAAQNTKMLKLLKAGKLKKV